MYTHYLNLDSIIPIDGVGGSIDWIKSGSLAMTLITDLAIFAICLLAMVCFASGKFLKITNHEIGKI
jgi:hypothetical protein